MLGPVYEPMYGMDAKARPVTGGIMSVRALPGRAKRAQTKHFQLFLDNTAGLIFITTADGTVCYESPACERVLGYTPEDMTGDSLLSFVHPDDTAALQSILTEVYPRTRHHADPPRCVTIRCPSLTEIKAERKGYEVSTKEAKHGVNIYKDRHFVCFINGILPCCD